MSGEGEKVVIVNVIIISMLCITRMINIQVHKVRKVDFMFLKMQSPI